ncbi:26S proteasome regulatory subunit N1 [Nematocida displodere]|uniref:26S proteasome regulatory subunit N1 n=1 Tax=Nematocida displodere TaxID=1805483 RepID=A0A177EF27_9MICR|nr:26S proteasome regulatory subunit N1 [Nematocida displodere]
MRGDLMVIVDNSMYSINRDCPGERLACQIDAIKSVCEPRLSERSESSSIGVMTLGRTATTKIVSPTSDKNTIYTYLHSIKRDTLIEGGSTISIARMALKYRTNQNQMILLFLGSPLDDNNLMMIVDSVGEALNTNIAVSVILFGEAAEYYPLFKNSIEESSEFRCIGIGANESFSEAVSVALGESIEDIDPELEMAIKQSLQDSEDPELARALKESTQQ